LALSYVIAPVIIQTLILYSCFVCSIICSLFEQVKASGFIVQGKHKIFFPSMAAYSMENINGK
jgi:hypothetical protein